MNPEHLFQIAAFLVSFGLIVFFTTAEAAFVGVNHMAIRTLAAAGDRRALQADKLISSRDRLVSDLLVGINTFTVVGSVLAASLTEEYAGAAYLGLTAAVLVLLVLIFAEMIPKALAYADATATAMRLAPAVTVASVLLRPVSAVLGLIPRWLSGRVGERQDDLSVTEESLTEMLRIGEEQGELAPDTGEVVSGILASQDKTVSDVMIPIRDAATAPVGASLSSLATLMERTGFSRIPIHRGSRATTTGVVHVKDVFARLCRGSGGTAADIMRPILRTPPGRKAADLLREMRSKRQHIAAIEDAGGRTIGLVTIQDLLEEIVGEIQEEPPASGAAGLGGGLGVGTDFGAGAGFDTGVGGTE